MSGLLLRQFRSQLPVGAEEGIGFALPDDFLDVIFGVGGSQPVGPALVGIESDQDRAAGELVAERRGEDGGDEGVDAGPFGFRRFLQLGIQLARQADEALLWFGHITHDIRDNDILCDIKQSGPRCYQHPAALVKGVEPVTSTDDHNVRALAAERVANGRALPDSPLARFAKTGEIGPELVRLGQCDRLIEPDMQAIRDYVVATTGAGR